MHLWTEYEGRTIDEHYTLGKLLRSEGRNGFFATSDQDGHAAVIRLTEAHFDEEEQLARWTHVSGVHQDNLIEIEQVGKTTFDGIPLTYALMEPDDANLGDVLKERPLTVAEATQVAKSVVAALAALHNNGLVHEHVEPSNVLAVGDLVKLRSDCVRECVADIEFNTPEGCAELRRRDVHAFGTLLLQCLTLEKEWSPTTNLPEPFKRLIPRALDGSWTLDQIAAFLNPTAAAPKSAPGSAVPAGTAAAGNPNPSAARPDPTAAPILNASPTRSNSEPNLAPVFRPESLPLHARRHATVPDPSTISTNKIWAICIGSALFLALLLWHFLGGKPAAPAAPAQSAAATSAQSAPAASMSTATGAASPAPAGQPSPVAAIAAGAPGWYVIAYTYNHQNQAQTKADRIAGRHSGLHPQVFSPSGHAPYLVALGGPMSEAEAKSTLHQARRSGMPRDTFIRRY